MITDTNVTINRLLNAAEVARVLNISKALVYRLMQSGDIPTVRFNRTVRVRQPDLDEYIQRCWSGWSGAQDQ